MTPKLVDFEPWHVEAIIESGTESGLDGVSPHMNTLVQENTKTIMLGDKPLACGGTLRMGLHRHMAWAFVADEAANHMPSVTKLAAKLLKQVNGRIEATVDLEFNNGHRWIKALGFTPYATLEHFGPNGETHVGYARYNGAH